MQLSKLNLMLRMRLKAPEQYVCGCGCLSTLDRLEPPVTLNMISGLANAWMDGGMPLTQTCSCSYKMKNQ